MKQYIQSGYFIIKLAILLLPLGCSQPIIWQNSDGLYRGFVTNIAAGADGLVLAVTNIGLYRSTDNGNTWSYVNTSNMNSPVQTLAVNSDGYIFVTTRDNVAFRSIDKGMTWVSLQSALTNAPVKKLVLGTSGKVFALEESAGILHSTNNGDSWNRINHKLKVSNIYSLAVDSMRTVLITTDTGVYRSIDNGSNWTMINQEFMKKPNLLVMNSSGHIFIGGSGKVGIYRSTDNGNSWTISYQIRMPHPVTRDTVAVNTTVIGLAINSMGHLFANIDYNLVRSTDNGDSWAKVSLSSINNALILPFAINSDDEIFAGTNFYGIIRSTKDCKEWTKIASNFASVNIYSLAINSHGHIFAGTDSSIFRSTDQGSNWIHIDQGIPALSSIRSVCINSQGDVFAGNFLDGVYRSLNNGDNWSYLSRAGMYLSTDPGDTIYVGSGIDGPYANRSTNNGSKWTRIDRDTAMGLISFAFNRSGHIFTGNAYGVVLRSTNSCQTWTELRDGLPPVGAISPDINALVINTSGYLFAGAEGGLCRSTNNGDNWERIDSQLPSSIRNINDTGHIDYYGFPRIRTIVINSKGHIFIGYDRGVYRSTNDGESWTDLNKGLSLNTTVNTLALDQNGYLYAGTSDGAVFRSSQSTTH